MERYSIALHGIDSYTKQPMYLPYKLDAASVKAALHEARMCALTDSVEGEIRLVTMDIDVSIHGQELRLLTDEQKNVIAIATADDLAPLQGEFANSAYMAFYLRTSSQGEKYIVVKDGFSVRAAIMQPDAKEALRDSLLEALTLLRVEGLKDGTVDITRQCWPTGGSKETEAEDEET